MMTAPAAGQPGAGAPRSPRVQPPVRASFAVSSAGPGRDRRIGNLSHRTRRFADCGCGRSREDLVYALGLRSARTPARRHGQSRTHFRHQRRRRLHRPGEGQRHADHVLRRRSGRRALRFQQQPGQDLCAGSGAGSGRHLRKRCLRRARVLALGTRQRALLGNAELFARSGNVDNPDRNWSPWTPVDLANGADLKVPPARFVQWKAVLHASNPAPRVDSVQLYYLPKNVAPQVDDVTVQPGYRYQVDSSRDRHGRADAGPAALRSTAAQHARPRFDRNPLVGARRQRRPDWNIRCTTAAMVNRAGCC